MRKENPFDKAFQDAFNRAEITPPDMAWSVIEQALPKKRKRKLAIWWFAAAATISAVLTFGWVQMNQNKTSALVAQEQLQDSIARLQHEIQRLNQQVAQQNANSFSGGPKTSQLQENTVLPSSPTTAFNKANNELENTSSIALVTEQPSSIKPKETLNQEKQSTTFTEQSLAQNQTIDLTISDSIAEKAILKNSIAQALKSGVMPSQNLIVDSIKDAVGAPIQSIENEEVASLGSTQEINEKTNTKNGKQSKLNWLVGGSIAPNVLAMSTTRGTIGNFEGDQSETLKQFDTESVAGSESKSVVAVQTALDFGVEISDRWLVTSGLGYVSWQNTNQTTQTVANLGASTAYANTTIDTTTISQNLDFLQLPIQAHYWLVNKRLKFGLGAGINALFGGAYQYKSESALSNTVLLDVEESSGGLYQLNPMVSSKLWYGLSKTVQLQIEPSFGVGILPRDLYFTSRPQRSFAFKTGLLVNL